MIADEVRAFGTRKNNAELMVDCASLGYLDGCVLDATYGTGRFWSFWRPLPHLFVTNDLDPASSTNSSFDFRSMWFLDEAFDTVVLDPPYKLNGTSTGKGPSASDASYGVDGPYRTVAEKHGLIKDGIIECARVSARFLLIKCMDQVVSGKKHWQTHIFARTAERCGFDLVDMLHVQGYRKQPPNRQQCHARGDYSTLLVCERET